MYFGADYYPEHWPRERWELDAKLMKQANFTVVRLAEFSWIKLEPEKGKYDFSWLDEAVNVLANEGIKVVLGTPTAAPPKWIMDENPGIYMKDAYGRVKGFGSRRHYCYNSPEYHDHTKRIVAEMAGHYQNNANVVSWQIDNELGNMGTMHCYCDNCLDAFKKWLKRKYGTIDDLNKEWGTVFWGQTYRNWDELILPAYTAGSTGESEGYSHNPSMWLDFCRFSSYSIAAYQRLQIDEIRKFSDKPITHNFDSPYSPVDFYELGKDLDFISFDNYVNLQWGKGTYQFHSMAHDLIRGIKDKNFWVMEQQSGPCGWTAMGDTPQPGQLRLWTYQAVAHGAEAIVYFRWRACTFGTEQYWYGILDHDGIPRRRYREIQQTGKEMKELSDLIIDSRVLSNVAMVKSYDNLWSHNFHKHNNEFNYLQLLINYYSALTTNNISCDVVPPDRDFNKYKIVFMPAFNLMTDALKLKVEEYVQQGGTLVITYRSGTRHWNNFMTTETLPGYFRNVSGVEVEEFDSLNGGRTVSIEGIMGCGAASVWCDVLSLKGAEALAYYKDNYYRNMPAITVNKYGNGKVYYIGCDLDLECLTRLMSTICEASGVKPVMSKPVPGVEIVKKEKSGKQYTIVLNYNDTQASVDLEGVSSNLLTGETIKGSLLLPAFGTAVLG